MTQEATQKKPRFSIPAPHVSASRWLIILLAQAVATAVLLTVGNRIISVPIFTFLPLIALLLFGREMFKGSVRFPKFRHVLLGIGLGFAALLVSLGVSILFQSVMSTTGNPITDVLTSGSLAQNLFTLFLNLIQLFGEELLTFVAFMLVLQVCSRFMKSGTAATVIAWIISAIVFALVHLSTYGFNVLQVLLIIGVARLVLSLGFIFTNNLIVSYISHIIDDNTIFIFTMIVAAMNG